VTIYVPPFLVFLLFLLFFNLGLKFVFNYGIPVATTGRSSCFLFVCLFRIQCWVSNLVKFVRFNSDNYSDIPKVIKISSLLLLLDKYAEHVGFIDHTTFHTFLHRLIAACNGKNIIPIFVSPV